MRIEASRVQFIHKSVFDAHFHLHKEQYEDYLGWRAEGLEGGIHASIHASDWQDAPAIAEWPGVTSAIGIHPWHIEEYTPLAAARLCDLLKEHPALLVGEIGLDYRFHPETRDKQLAAFREQIQIASSYRRKAVIHLLWAARDFLRVMDDFRELPFIIHSCSEDASTVRKIVSRFPNAEISFGFNLLRDSGGHRSDAAKAVPLSRRRTDSDYPFMRLGNQSPAMPTQCALIARKLSEIPFEGKGLVVCKN